MAKGRKGVPAKIHQLHGTYRDDRHGGELKVDCVMPDPPDWLNDIAKKEWLRIAPVLKKYKVLSDMDITVLEMYCVVYARWISAEKKMQSIRDGEISETPNGYQQQSAWLQIANTSIKQMQSLCAEFGMSPATRARMKLIESKPKQLDLLSLLDQVSKSKAAAVSNG